MKYVHVPGTSEEFKWPVGVELQNDFNRKERKEEPLCAFKAKANANCVYQDGKVEEKPECPKKRMRNIFYNEPPEIKIKES